MSTQEEKISTPSTTTAAPAATEAEPATAAAPKEAERSDKILKAKELYSHGSRNFLVKSYADAADELSQVCGLFEELHGELCDELGMPYLLYAKSLIALALDENKVIDVPDEEDDDDDDDTEEGEGDDDAEVVADCAADAEKQNGEAASSTNGAKASAKLEAIKETPAKPEEADSTAASSGDAATKTVEVAKNAEGKPSGETQVTSTDDAVATAAAAESATKKKPQNGSAANVDGNGAVVQDGEKPSTSNGEVDTADGAPEEEDNEAASNLQLAWEILELAAKIFSRQGLSGLPNLAEVQTELANIEFENNILDAAREDYEKALKIYTDLPTNYRRAMAEIHYKIGLTYLMQQLNKEGAASLKEACSLIEGEIEEIKAKSSEITDKDKNNIQDMEETKQEIWAKITEIEETQAQNIAEVRAALDSYIKPITAQSSSVDGAACSSTSTTAAATSSSSSASAPASKPTDISHLIKRKKPDEPSSVTEADAASPAKRPAV